MQLLCVGLGGGGEQYNMQYNCAAISRWVYIYPLFSNVFLTKLFDSSNKVISGGGKTYMYM